MTAIAEYLNVWYQVSNYQINNTPDKVIWKWTSDGKFTVHSAYNALHIGSHPFQGCQLIWDTWAPLRVKIFHVACSTRKTVDS